MPEPFALASKARQVGRGSLPEPLAPVRGQYPAAGDDDVPVTRGDVVGRVEADPGVAVPPLDPRVRLPRDRLADLELGLHALAAPTRLGTAQISGFAVINTAANRLRDRPAAAAGRLFIDAWDLEQFSSCPRCALPRQARLTQLNLDQRLPPPLTCAACGEVTPS